MTITQIILLQIFAFILILLFAAMFRRHQRIILWSAAIVIFTGTLLLIGLGVIDLIKDNRPNMTVATGVFNLRCPLYLWCACLWSRKITRQKQGKG